MIQASLGPSSYYGRSAGLAPRHVACASKKLPRKEKRERNKQQLIPDQTSARVARCTFFNHDDPLPATIKLRKSSRAVELPGRAIKCKEPERSVVNQEDQVSTVTRAARLKWLSSVPMFMCCFESAIMTLPVVIMSASQVENTNDVTTLLR